MSRIRTVKPEWVDDEGLHQAGIVARLMSIQLISLADDYGNGRAHPGQLAGRLFWNEDNAREMVEDGLAKLREAGFLTLYEVRGQRYYHVNNWAKHQRVDKPGKPRVPKHDESDVVEINGVADSPEKIPETLAKVPGSLATDQDPDPDPDQDPDRDREGSARERAPTFRVISIFEEGLSRAGKPVPCNLGHRKHDKVAASKLNLTADQVRNEVGHFVRWLGSRPPTASFDVFLKFCDHAGEWGSVANAKRRGSVARARPHSDFDDAADVDEQLEQQLAALEVD